MRLVCPLYYAAIQSQSFPRGIVAAANKHQLNVPGKHWSLPPSRKTSSSSSSDVDVFASLVPASPTHSAAGTSTSSTLQSVSGLLFALKHWIGKHFFVSQLSTCHTHMTFDLPL